MVAGLSKHSGGLIPAYVPVAPKPTSNASDPTAETAMTVLDPIAVDISLPSLRVETPRGSSP
jgi:hypothetical protein